jgi:acyl-CoA synthetase (AMP-forming)/AMP-acid ligase II
VTYIDFLVDRFRRMRDADAVVWRDRTFSYGDLCDAIDRASQQLQANGIRPGAMVSLEADFSPTAIGMLFALIAHECIVVPMTPALEGSKATLRRIAEVETIIETTTEDIVVVRATGVAAKHAIIGTLRERRHPGLVIFSSGSTGTSKAALHDLVPVLEQFHDRGLPVRAISFLLFDHIGGINTLFSILGNGGCLVVVEERSPERVCEAIARHRVELLPATPTFLNLLLVSEAYRHWDLASLKIVSYGTEVMPAGTLRRLRAALPHVKAVQKYGSSELGILQSKTRPGDALWLKIGDERCSMRVVNGMLEVRTPAAMLGYLNAPNPFTPDGWFPTGDAVEVDGEYIRVLGRRSEMINIGGEKVHPAEIENVLQEMDGVVDVVVVAEPHLISGQIAKARVQLSTAETLEQFRTRMRRFCRDKLPRYKIPQKVELAADNLHAARFKKLRA